MGWSQESNLGPACNESCDKILLKNFHFSLLSGGEPTNVVKYTEWCQISIEYFIKFFFFLVNIVEFL